MKKVEIKIILVRRNVFVLIFGILALTSFILVKSVLAGTLSCSLTASCTSTNVIFKMSGTSNAHAGLPSSSYTQLVCCSGVTGLGNDCASTTKAVVVRLSGTTNAHVSQTAYANQACISVPAGGTVSAGTSTDCIAASYDTTLASMSANTNAHVGASSTYAIKICAKAAAGGAVPTISCSTNVGSTDFGTWTDTSIKTSSPNASTTMSCSNTSAGCTLYVKDDGGGGNPGLWNSSASSLIESPTAANPSNATDTLSAGAEGYGIQATTTAAGLTIAPRYLQTGDIVGGLKLTNTTLASSTADISNAQVIVTHKAAVSDSTFSGSYSDTITYECVVN